MEKLGKIGLKISALIISILVTSYLFSVASALISKPSDFSVGSGTGIILVLFVLWMFIIPKFYRWFKKDFVSPAKESETKNSNSEINNLVVIFAFLIASQFMEGCTRIGPGHIGIKISMAGDDRGVNDIPTTTGWVPYNPFAENVYEYPTFVQTVVWTRDTVEASPTNEEISFNSKEGLTITADISFSYRIDAKKAPFFYVKFRNDDLMGYTHGYFRNVTRDVINEIAGKYSVEEIYGPKKDSLIAEVKRRVIKEVSLDGVILEQFGFIGAPRPPKVVIEALNAKVAANQDAMRAENELRKIIAQARQTEEEARGKAKANALLAESISDKLIEWRKLDLNEKALVRWKGDVNNVLINDGKQSTGLLFSIPSK